MQTSIRHPASCILLLLIGCSASAPMSETLTYYHGRTTEEEPVVNLIHHSLHWDGAKGFLKSDFETEAQSNPAYIENTRSNVNYPLIGVLGWSQIYNHFAMSISAGIPFVLSSDMTFRLPFDVFSTNRASFGGGYETILQKPVFKTDWMSLNLGYSYRIDTYHYEFRYYRTVGEPCIIIFCSDTGRELLSETARIHGPRLSITSPYVYMFAHYGAFSNLKRPVFFLTISTAVKY
jgi:hypothetical protein